MTDPQYPHKRFPLLLAAFAICTASLAQVNVDSLRAVANDMNRPDSIRFTAWYDMVWDGYLFNAPDTAFELGTALQREARERGSKTFIARSSELLAASWYVRGDLKTALLHYDTALAMHRTANDKDGMADVLTNMASMRSFLGERDLALKLYEQGLSIHEEIHDSVGIANDLNAIGVVHRARGDHARAVELFNRALRMLEVLRNDPGISIGHANLGATLTEQGDHSNALVHFKEALRIAERLNDQHLVGKDLEEVGSCLEALNDTTAAMDHYSRSLSVREALNDHHGIVNVNNRIADLLLAQGRSDQALTLFEKSAALARQEELPWGLGNALVGVSKCMLANGRNTEALAAAREAMSAAEESEDLSRQRDAAEVTQRSLRALGRWKEALDAYTTMVALSDSVMREENQRAVLHNEYAYAYEKQAYADSVGHALDKREARLESDERESSERFRRNVAIAIGTLLAILVFVFWQRARILKRTNTSILNVQNKLLESERAREADAVRTSIARDIHDQLGSDLTKLVMLSDEVTAMVNDGSTLETTTAIKRVARDATRSLSDIVWAVDPEQDDLSSLVERIRLHSLHMLGGSSIEHTIDCVHTGERQHIDPSTKRAIQLIHREALNNAIKHAKATRMDILFHSNSDRITMHISDNGVGLSGPVGMNGNGIQNMQRRAERIGGMLELDQTTKGTSLHFMLRTH
ncbi:MAG: tetratricopeptide repeat protein [Flavobacteriales bacterium]